MKYDEFVEDAQRRLVALGYKTGGIDGFAGPQTRASIRAFQKAKAIKVTGNLSPATVTALFNIREDSIIIPANVALARTPPHVIEMSRRLGLNERNNFKELSSWLKSGGKYINPIKQPWCGDAIETAVLLAYPDEPVPTNPFGARNWLKFGKEVKPTFGAIGVFWRGRKSGWAGHVGILVDEVGPHYVVLGGNQSNSISLAKIAKSRLLGARWPVTYDGPIPKKFPDGDIEALLSTNEA
jgi:hypothetical protein